MGSLLKTTLQHEVLGCFLCPGRLCAVRPPAAVRRLCWLPLCRPHRPRCPHRCQAHRQLQDRRLRARGRRHPADAQLIELKETDHSYDVLVPGPVKYVSTPVAYPHAYGYAGLGLPYYGLPVAAPAAAEAEE